MLNSNDITLSLQGYINLYDITNEISKVLASHNNLFIKHKSALEQNVSNFPINNSVDLRLYGVEKLCNVVEACLRPLNESQDVYTSLKENVIKAYIKMAYFAQKSGTNSEELCICSVLRAMKLGSMEGIQLFPYVLNMQNLGTIHKEFFMSEVIRLLL